jgi:6,7-dimethyl-8-ribityllumazine synthase
VQPGHIFPLQAVDGGVLMRAGHTEAGCDLAAMAGCSPAAVICEIMKDDGTMARLPDLQLFAAEHGLKIGTIADLIEHRSRNESLVEKSGTARCDRARRIHRPRLPRQDRAGLHLALVKGAGRRATPCPCACTSRCRCSTRWKSTRHALLEPGRQPGAHRSRGRGVAVLLNCGESAAQLLAQFEGTARAAHGARARPHGPAHLRRRARRSCANAGCTHAAAWATRGACPAWPATAWKSSATSPLTTKQPRNTDMFGRRQGNPGQPPAARLRIGIVQARFNEGITNALAQACLAELRRWACGPRTSPMCGARRAGSAGGRCRPWPSAAKYDALIALGCIIRGETYHFELVANESGAGVTAWRWTTSMPIANAILTTENMAQAVAARRQGPRRRARGGRDGQFAGRHDSSHGHRETATAPVHAPA